MNIGENLQFLETHYIQVWIKKWQRQLQETSSEEERSELLTLIEKAEQEIAKREN